MDAPPVATIAFNNAADSVLMGRTKQVLVLLKDAGGRDLTGPKITYESLTPTVATIDQTGLVTPVRAGDAQLKATADGRSATAGMRVLEPATRVVLTPQNEQVPLGTSRNLIATVTGANGQAITGRIITWSSSNPLVASAGAPGVVQGITKGTSTIKARVELDAIEGTAQVTVVDVPVASVTVTPPGAQIIRLGATLQANAILRDAANNVLSGRTITWSSSNPAVATVSTNGLVTSVGLGTARITAESETRTGTMDVQVTEVPPKSVTLSPDTVALLSSNTRQLTPVVIDSLNRTVTSLATRQVVWLSSNNAVATVSASGVVTALTGGTARISVTVDNVRSNDVVVIVTDQVQSVQITPSVIAPLRVGNTMQLTATPLNNQGQPIAGKTVTWTSSNPSVATVDQTGRVTGVAFGVVSITAQVDQKTATVGINVTLVPIGTVTLPALDTLAGGDVKQYNPIVTDSAGRVVPNLLNRTVIWQSNNQPVATVNGGIVQGSTTQSGNAVITVIIDNVSSNNMTVTVAQITSLVATPNAVTIAVSGTQQLSVVAKDAGGRTITTTKTLSYFTGNSAIATVSPAGLVTGVAVGTTNITVTIQGVPGVSVVVPVTVNP